MITFPITLEAFMADWEQPIDALTQDLISEYVKLFNLEFEAGLKGREPTDIASETVEFYTAVGKLDDLERPTLKQLYACVQYWCSEAYRQGKEARQEGAGG